MISIGFSHFPSGFLGASRRTSQIPHLEVNATVHGAEQNRAAELDLLEEPQKNVNSIDIVYMDIV